MHNCKCYEPKGANDWGQSYNMITEWMYETDILKIIILSFVWIHNYGKQSETVLNFF